MFFVQSKIKLLRIVEKHRHRERETKIVDEFEFNKCR